MKELILDDVRTCTTGWTWRKRAHFLPGLAGVILLSGSQRHKLGPAFNEMVRKGELKAPVICLPHLIPAAWLRRTAKPNPCAIWR